MFSLIENLFKAIYINCNDPLEVKEDKAYIQKRNTNMHIGVLSIFKKS